MPQIELGGKVIATQTGTDNPVLGSTVNIPSGVTFPAGHIIQTISFTSTTYAESSSLSFVDAVSGTIELSSSSNKLLVLAVARGEVTPSGTNIHAGIKLTTSGTGVSAEEYLTYELASSTYPYGITLTGSSATRLGFSYPVNNIFSPNYQGNVTVTLSGSAYNTGYGLIFNKVSPQCSEMILMEIMQ